MDPTNKLSPQLNFTSGGRVFTTGKHYGKPLVVAATHAAGLERSNLTRTSNHVRSNWKHVWSD